MSTALGPCFGGPKVAAEECLHLPKRLYSWRAADGVLVVVCFQCDSVLQGAA